MDKKNERLELYSLDELQLPNSPKMLNYTFTLDDLQLCDKRDFEGSALLTYEAHSSLQRVMLVTALATVVLKQYHTQGCFMLD